jgi:hypothetical protein
MKPDEPIEFKRALGKRGRPKKGEEKGADSTLKRGSTSRKYILARLDRDGHGELAAKVRTLSAAMVGQLKAAAKERQLTGKGVDGSGGRGKKKNHGAKSPQGKTRAPKVTEQIAKGAKVADSRRPPSAEAPGGRHTPVRP